MAHEILFKISEKIEAQCGEDLAWFKAHMKSKYTIFILLSDFAGLEVNNKTVQVNPLKNVLVIFNQNLSICFHSGILN